MLRTGSGVVLAVVLVVGLAPSAVGQETKSARGSVTAVSATSITVKAGERDLTFAVDQKTGLVASGAGTATRRADAAGKPGPRLTDFVKAGDAVEVDYQETGTAMRATNIRRVSSPGSGGGTTSDDRAMTTSGTVASISGSTLTISGSAGGGGTFTQSYAVNRETKVVAAGAGTAAAKQGGTIAITDAVSVGDQVTVTYRKAGNGLHAEEVRVTAKKK
jgi:hypothetical protein